MTKREKILLNVITDLVSFVLITYAMLFAKDLIQTVKYGFMLVAITIINKK